MSICKQNKFQLAHLDAERGRARAGRYSSVWKQQFGRAALKSTIVVLWKHSQAVCSYSSVVSTRLSLMIRNAQSFLWVHEFLQHSK